MKPTKTRIAAATLLVFTAALPAIAEVDPDRLYQKGKEALEGSDCVTAHAALYAFRLMASEAMTPEGATKVAEAIAYCRDKLASSVERVPQLEARVLELERRLREPARVKNEEFPPPRLPALQTVTRPSRSTEDASSGVGRPRSR
jgi:hypothetical protein